MRISSMRIELIRKLGAFKRIFNSHLLFNSIRQIELTLTLGLRNACKCFNAN